MVEKDDFQLDFRPMTEGLGFHPFSDGLPYAPVTKAPTVRPRPASFATGAGAVSAGPAIPVLNFKPAPQISVPVAAQVAPQVAPAPAPHVTAEEATPNLMFRRSFAYVVDTLFNGALCLAALSAVLWKENLSLDLLVNPGVVLVSSLFVLFFNWALITAQEIAFGTSMGKRLFRMSIPGSATAIFFRAILFVPSVAFGGIGLAWSLFDRKHRCWHDIATGTHPVLIPKF